MENFTLCVVYHTHTQNQSGLTLGLQWVPRQPQLPLTAQRWVPLSLSPQATAFLANGISEFHVSLCKYWVISDSFSKAPRNPAKAAFCPETWEWLLICWFKYKSKDVQRGNSQKGPIVRTSQGGHSHIYIWFASALHRAAQAVLCSQASLTLYFKTIAIFD